MRKIKNKKNSREGRWQVAVWNRGGGGNGEVAPSIHACSVYRRVYTCKTVVFWQTACQSTPLGARQEELCVAHTSARKQAIYNYNYIYTTIVTIILDIYLYYTII